MIVYNSLTEKIEEIEPEEFSGIRHLPSQHWTKRQRRQVIDQYITADETLADYMKDSDSNPAILFREAIDRMESGKLPFNMKVLYILMKGCEAEYNKEQEQEEPHH